MKNYLLIKRTKNFIERTMIKDMMLYNPETNTEFKVKFTKLSGMKFSKLVMLEQNFRNVKKEANLLFLLANSDENTLKANLQSNDALKAVEPILNAITKGETTVNEVAEMFEAAAPEIIINNLKYRIEIIKEMIDKSSLSDELLTLIEKPAFWDEQDIEEVQRVSDSFRQLIRK